MKVKTKVRAGRDCGTPPRRRPLVVVAVVAAVDRSKSELVGS